MSKTSPSQSRRFLLRAFAPAAGTALLSPRLVGAAPPGQPAEPERPGLHPAFEIDMDLAEPRSMGMTGGAERCMHPILGGVVRGTAVQGTVLPGGADWRLARADGAQTVEASCSIQAEDGTLLTLSTKGTSRNGSSEIHIVVEFAAPDGRYTWLNSTMFVGVLAPRERGARLRVYRLG